MACPKCGYNNLVAEDVCTAFEKQCNSLISYLLDSGNMRDIIAECISVTRRNNVHDTARADRWARIDKLLEEVCELLDENRKPPCTDLCITNTESYESLPDDALQLYELSLLEINGEQFYVFSELVAARDIKHASELGRERCRTWYFSDDEDDMEIIDMQETYSPDVFEFFGGWIRVRLDGVFETTFEEWVESQIEIKKVGEIPARLLPYQRAQEQNKD